MFVINSDYLGVLDQKLSKKSAINYELSIRNEYIM